MASKHLKRCTILFVFRHKEIKPNNDIVLISVMSTGFTELLSDDMEKLMPLKENLYSLEFPGERGYICHIGHLGKHQVWSSGKAGVREKHRSQPLGGL